MIPDYAVLVFKSDSSVILRIYFVLLLKSYPRSTDFLRWDCYGLVSHAVESIGYCDPGYEDMEL